MNVSYYLSHYLIGFITLCLLYNSHIYTVEMLALSPSPLFCTASNLERASIMKYYETVVEGDSKYQP